MTVKRVIRSALTTGVLFFGAVIYWLRQSGDYTTTLGPGEDRGFRFAFYAVAALCAGAMAFLFGQIRRATSPGQRQTAQIMAWAAAEAVALYGGVFWLRSGNPAWYVMGVTIFLAALIIFRDHE